MLNISRYQITGEYFIITMNISNLYQIYMIFPFLIYIKINSYICADISFNLLKSLYIYVQLFLKKCIAVFLGVGAGKAPPSLKTTLHIQKSSLLIYISTSPTLLKNNKRYKKRFIFYINSVL